MDGQFFQIYYFLEQLEMNFKLVIFQYRVTRKALFRAKRRAVLSERTARPRKFP